MAISEFKASALKTINGVAKSRETIIITKEAGILRKWFLIANP